MELYIQTFYNGHLCTQLIQGLLNIQALGIKGKDWKGIGSGLTTHYMTQIQISIMWNFINKLD